MVVTFNLKIFMKQKQIDKQLRAKAIKDLTDNGKKRIILKKLENFMENPENLAILNALFAATTRTEK